MVMIKKRAISGFAKSWVLLLAVLAGCSARPEFAPQKPDSADYAPPVLDYSLPEATDGSSIVINTP